MEFVFCVAARSRALCALKKLRVFQKIGLREAIEVLEMRISENTRHLRNHFIR